MDATQAKARELLERLSTELGSIQFGLLRDLIHFLEARAANPQAARGLAVTVTGGDEQAPDPLEYYGQSWAPNIPHPTLADRIDALLARDMGEYAGEWEHRARAALREARPLLDPQAEEDRAVGDAVRALLKTGQQFLFPAPGGGGQWRFSPDNGATWQLMVGPDANTTEAAHPQPAAEPNWKQRALQAEDSYMRSTGILADALRGPELSPEYDLDVPHPAWANKAALAIRRLRREQPAPTLQEEFAPDLERLAEEGKQAEEDRAVGAMARLIASEHAAPTVPPDLAKALREAGATCAWRDAPLRHPGAEGFDVVFADGEGVLLHRDAQATWEGVIDDARLHDNRPPLTEWAAANGGEEAAVHEWCLAQEPQWDFFPRRVLYGYAGITDGKHWRFGDTPAAALAAACEAAGVPTPWGPGKAVDLRDGLVGACVLEDGKMVQTFPPVDKPAAPAEGEWQPPETVEACLDSLLGKWVVMVNQYATGYYNVGLAKSTGHRPEYQRAGYPSLLSGLQDLCYWVHHREEASQDAD